YRIFWRWLEGVVNHALITQRTPTVFDWHLHVGDATKLRTLQNFPMQANGAEMLRLACWLRNGRGIEIVAPVHVPVPIVAPADHLEADVGAMGVCMSEASRVILAGFELGSDAKIVKYPNRFMDERGEAMWRRVMGLLENAEARKRA